MAVKLVLGVAFLFFAGRFYGADVFGAYAIGVAVLELGVAVGGLENKKLLFKALDRRAPSEPAEHVLVNAGILTVLASTVVALVMASMVAIYSALLGASPMATTLLLMFPMIIGQASVDFLLAATRWKHVMRYDILARNIVEPLLLLTVSVAAYWGGFDRFGLVAAYWITVLVTAIYAAYGVARTYNFGLLSSARLSKRQMHTMFSDAKVNVVSNVCHVLATRLDLYLVGLLLGEKMAGIHAMARQVQSPTGAVRKSFDGIVYPLVSKTIERKGVTDAGLALASVSYRILAIETVIIVILIAFGRQILQLVGPEFTLAYYAMIVLAVAESIQAAFGLGDLIFTYRAPRLELLSILLAVLTGMISGVLLIPALGVLGAAFSVLLAYVFRAAARRFFLRKHLSVHTPLLNGMAVYAPACIGVLATAAACLLSPLEDDWMTAFTACVAGLMIFAAAMKAASLLPKGDLKLRDFETK